MKCKRCCYVASLVMCSEPKYSTVTLRRMSGIQDYQTVNSCVSNTTESPMQIQWKSNKSSATELTTQKYVENRVIKPTSKKVKMMTKTLRPWKTSWAWWTKLLLRKSGDVQDVSWWSPTDPTRLSSLWRKYCLSQL